jgi:hypothetical protein
MTRPVMKDASKLLWTPLSKLGQRKTSKLLLPYICLGSSWPVEGFTKSLSTKISFHAVTKLVEISYATSRLPSIPKKRVSER